MAKSSSDRQRQTEMRNEIELSFHKQFAENQNHHQNVLFKLLTVLAGVILGYGYILHGYVPRLYWCIQNDSQYETREVIFALIVSEIVLLIGLAAVSNMGFGFRRDQLVNFKIRRKHGIIARNRDEDNIFLFSYNPMHDFVVLEKDDVKVKHLRLINWMPEFHKIFSITFFIFQLICCGAFVIKTQSDSFFSFHEWLSYLSFVFPLFSFWILLKYRCKIKKYYQDQGRFTLKILPKTKVVSAHNTPNNDAPSTEGQ